MVSQYAATLLRQDLDKIPLWRGNHVGVKQVVEDYARYLYLQRLRESEVVLSSMRDGLTLTSWSMDSFAYAEGWDEANQRYTGLQAGRIVSLTPDSTGFLVKPDVAMKQLAAERPEPRPAGAPPVASAWAAQPREHRRASA